jgi:hypothetical protein
MSHIPMDATCRKTVVAHGPDRNLSVDEVGRIQPTENESLAGARA